MTSKVVVGQPASAPWKWVVNILDGQTSTTYRIFTGPRAERLAVLYGTELAKRRKLELVVEG